MTRALVSILHLLPAIILRSCRDANPISKISRANYDQIHEKIQQVQDGN
jgi:hypothetical protein